MSSLNGFTREVTTLDGVTHSAAYYKVARVAIDNQAKKATVSMIVWASVAAHDGDSGPIGGLPDEHAWRTEGTEFDTYFAPSVIDAVDKNDRSQAYLYAKAKINDPGIADVTE